MEVFESLDAISLPDSGGPVFLAVGTFDGVHLGHQALLNDLCERAAAAGGLAVAFTFQNHPRSVVTPKACPRLLSPWPLKRRLLGRLPLHAVVAPRFDEMLRRMEALDFVAGVLVGRCRAHHIQSGENFRFGHDRAGGPQLLEKLAGPLGFSYQCLLPVLGAGERISSSRIRAVVGRGEVETAAALLGRPHQFSAPVVSGDGLGRRIGFPTANLAVDPAIQLPADGVYAVLAYVRDDPQPHPAMMNLGFRPTVGGRDHRAEVHLIGFAGDLVGAELTIQFVARLRGEERFPSPEALTQQLARDRENSLQVLEDQRAERY
ncbi:MAG: riboflavin kinase / adenylyltransferase [Candidatus Sumerlaeota bacterium]|nr:riboflavin kinase / adenylyltransferase [Candidatus Sumerlaeota bacterium]